MTPAPRKFPISEIFRSIQGEGHYRGTLMTFIRFAGCNVGKPYTAAARDTLGLQVYQERCTAWNGESFACDNNYRKHEEHDTDELLEHPLVKNAERVLLTGGEPLMYQPAGLIRLLMVREKYVHIETSGTFELGSWALDRRCWVCVSPKQGCRPQTLYNSKEIKVLVGPDFDESKFLVQFSLHLDRVWVQPINAEHELNSDNLRKCIELIHRFPMLRLSDQGHKIWKIR